MSRQLVVSSLVVVAFTTWSGPAAAEVVPPSGTTRTATAGSVTEPPTTVAATQPATTDGPADSPVTRTPSPTDAPTDGPTGEPASADEPTSAEEPTDPTDEATADPTDEPSAEPTEAVIDGPAVRLAGETPGARVTMPFQATAGQRIMWEFFDLAPDTAATDATVRVYRPDGTQWWSAGETGWSDVVSVPTTGTYTAVMAPALTYVGAVSFRVSSPPADAVADPVEIGGAAVSLGGTVRGQVARTSFTGTAGARVMWELSGLTPDDSGTDVTTQVLRPDGTLLWSGTDNVWSDVVTLPADGTYTVTMDAVGELLRTISFQVMSAPADAVGASVSLNGRSVRLATTTKGQVARTSFAGTAGQKVTWDFFGLDPDDAGTDVTTRVLRPDGTQLWTDADNGWSDIQSLPATGRYTVVVDPAGARVRALSFQLSSPPPDVVADPVSPDDPAVLLENLARGQVARTSFAGSAGQRVLWETSNLTPNAAGTDVTVTILRPDGVQLWTDADNGWSDVQTLPQDGTYTVFVDPVGDLVRSIDFQLSGPPADRVVGPAQLNGPAVTMDNVSRGQLVRTSFQATAGQRVTWEFFGLTPDAGGVDVTTRVFRPDGTQLWADTDNGRSVATRLPLTGTYTVTVDPAGDYLRSISFIMRQLPS